MDTYLFIQPNIVHLTQKGEFMMSKDTYNIASLSQDSLQQLRSLEKELRQETGDELILIAYEADQEEIDSELGM